MICIVFQGSKVEFSEPSGPITILHTWGHNPLFNKSPVHPETLDHVKGGGLKRRCAQICGQLVFGLKQKNAGSLISKEVGSDKANRAGAGDNDIGLVHISLPFFFSDTDLGSRREKRKLIL
jgi:hypothetical protein